MFRVLFLMVILMSSVGFAQTPNEKPQAIKYDEFGDLPGGDMKARFDGLYSEMINVSTTNGSIIIYGSERQLARREKFFKTFMAFRRVDTSRISIIKGGHRNEIMTQFWIVPLGAEAPSLEPVARKIAEFGKVTGGFIKMRTDAFFVELNAKKDAQGYIFNYGTPRETAAREKIIRNTISFRRYDSSKINIVNGGKGLKTQFWLVPAGAEVPTP